MSEDDRVPADGWVLSAHELAVDESLLSGESLPVAKLAELAQESPGESAEEGLRVFAGTLAIGGQGLVRVSAVGSATALGASASPCRRSSRRHLRCNAKWPG